MITIVGGTYHELCMVPHWNEYYGSAGRAASVIATLGADVELISFMDAEVKEVLYERSILEGFILKPNPIQAVPKFSYHHSLETPTISVPVRPDSSLRVKSVNVIRYGLIESDAIVQAVYAVYDPQNPHNPRPFSENGSSTEHLALVLNEQEARKFSGLENGTAEECARNLLSTQSAEVVIIKMGPKGALVAEVTQIHNIPAFITDKVWKIGSGDTFVAVFGYFWMEKKLSPKVSAYLASKATAYYCQTRGFPNETEIHNFPALELQVSAKFLDGYKPKVYLAGPFFSLAQLWIIDEARKNLISMGLEVFSPYHDVGRGSAEDVVSKDLEAIKTSDLMLAVGDGLDSGTMYEIGYARALGKPVIMYSENETAEDKKMMQGSGCNLCDDYVTSIYKTVWIAASL